VAEQQHWLYPTKAAEIRLQVIAEFFHKVYADFGAEFAKPRSKDCTYPVHCLLDIAGGFDLDQLADRFHHLRLFSLEIAELLSGAKDGHGSTAIKYNRGA
jgi:hypothetical protein